MTGYIPKEKLTAYQRWELAAFDEEAAAPPKAVETPAAEPAPPAAAPAPAAPPAADAVPEEPPIALPTAEDIERIHEEAHKQGYEAGYAEGIADAHAAAEQMENLLDGVKQAVQGVDQHVADQLLATSVEIANQVLRQSLQIKPDLLLPIVREAIAALHYNTGHPALFVHPLDAALIRANMGEQLAHNNWRILEDSSLTRGGCRIELGASEVDSTLETRWKRVIESIGVTQDWLDGKSSDHERRS